MNKLLEALQKSREAFDALMPHVRAESEVAAAAFEQYERALALVAEARELIGMVL